MRAGWANARWSLAVLAIAVASAFGTAQAAEPTRLTRADCGRSAKAQGIGGREDLEDFIAHCLAAGRRDEATAGGSEPTDTTRPMSTDAEGATRDRGREQRDR
ncbi:MAG: hypothetical protein H6983_18885 [Ectothiorhodospiraceae bacterium]|nr:hypothetical protein [Ectothiorhodospiraceae bacterium]